MRFARFLLAGLLLAQAAPADASHVVYIQWTGSSRCATSTCAVDYAEHFVWSDPSLHCTYAGGSVTSCRVFDECLARTSGGPLFTTTLSCTGGAPDSRAALAGNASLYSAAYVTIPVNGCATLVLTATASSAIDSTGVSDARVICVDSTGPYER